MAPLSNLLSSFDLSQYLESLSLKEREALTHPHPEVSRRDVDNLKSPGPWAVAVPSPITTSVNKIQLQARNNPTGTLPAGTAPRPLGGAVNPSDVNMKAIQASFAIIGAGMVVGIIWFFFWAKNGGFKWRKGDWDEYKSTVLRRKGPNGTTLSNATKSTRLGGGSVVGQGYSDRDASSIGFTDRDETSTVYTGTMTDLSSNAPIIKEKQGQYTGDKRDRRKKRAERAKDRKQREMQQAAYEGAHDADVRAYMAEKPARVGGINAQSDTLHYGTDYTASEGSAYSSQPRHHHQDESYHAQATAPPAVPRHSATPSRTGARNSRRDFSYTIGGHQEQQQFSVAPSSRSDSPPPMRVPARSVQQANTQAYFHPIPGLSAAGTPPPTGRHGGFRRGAGTDLDD